MRVGLATCLALAASSCTLAGLAEFEPALCVSDAECEVVNVDEGIDPSECMRWQCTADAETGGGHCVKRLRDDDDDGAVAGVCGGDDCDDLHAEAAPGGDEVCDGLDGDCDGVIDETAMRPSASVVLADDDVVVGLAASDDALMWTTGLAEASWLPLDGSAAVPMPFQTEPQIETAVAPMPLCSLRELALRTGCQGLDATGEPTVSACAFGEVAIDWAASIGIAIAVNTNGCAAGQVRVGHVDLAETASPALVVRGPTRRSNVFLGVDLVTADGDPDRFVCSGAGRPESEHGAARPSIAALRTGGAGAQALAAWLAAPASRADCGGPEADVAVLGVIHQTGLLVVPFGWVTGSNDGVPQVVGRSRGGGAPGVAAREGVGYFVGHGDLDGRLALHFVAPAEEPPPVDPLGETGLQGECADPSDATPPLSITSYLPIAASGGGPVDSVTLAVDRDLTSAPHLGVAWREGCGGDEAIYFRHVTMTASGPTPSIAGVGDAIRLSATANAVSEPAVVHVDEGVLGAAAGAADDGGFIVAWIDRGQNRVLARRISERDGMLLDEPALELGPPGTPAHLSVSGDGTHASFAWADERAHQIVSGGLTCSGR